MRLLIAALTVPMLSLSAANDWENLQVNSINREPARAYTMPLASEEAAFTDAIVPESPYCKSLNGIWKISWAGNPQLRVKDFYRVDYPDCDWFTIDVPSCVEMRGFGSPGYVNVLYPHKMEWPFIKDRQSGKSDYNPVSSYRRTFTVPAEWKGRVLLRTTAGDPLLVEGAYGKGRVFAFLASPLGDESRDAKAFWNGNAAYIETMRKLLK